MVPETDSQKHVYQRPYIDKVLIHNIRNLIRQKTDNIEFVISGDSSLMMPCD